MPTDSNSTCQRTSNREIPLNPDPLHQGRGGGEEIVSRHVVLSVFLVVFTVGCASFSGVPSTVKTACSYEQAWSVALASVDEFSLREVEKAKGVIATDWMGFTSKRKAGWFSREANQERARFFVNLKPTGQTVEISVQQAREFYSSMGARSQGIAWKRIPPIAEEERRLAQRITNQLIDKGCTVVS